MRLQTAGLMLVVMHARALLAPNGRRVFAGAASRCSFSQRLRTLAASRADLEGLTVPVLKYRLRAQCLKVGGKKAELVERLLESAPVPAAPAASAPAPAAPAASATPAPVKQTKPRRGDGRPHANPHNAERCEAEIVSFGPLGAFVAVHKSNYRGASPPLDTLIDLRTHRSVVVEFRDGRFGEGLVLQKELQYLRESRRGAGAEMGEMVSAFAAPSPTVEGKYDVFLRPPSAEGKNRDAAALILAVLERRGGKLDVGDKSSPEDIAAILPGLSKSVFKNAVGNLYRAKKVVPGRHEVRLAE